MIKQFEGYKDHAYKCLPEEQFYTIGYGHYGIKDPNLTITKEEAEQYLKEDLKVIAEAIEPYNNYYEFTEQEYDAILSFCYNLGASIMLQLTKRFSRNKLEIADAMLKYNKAGNKILSGLVNRRYAEYKLFTQGIYPNDTEIKETKLITEDTTLKEIVDMIIAGDFGNGDKRKENIYNTIQNLVNKRYK